MAAVGDELAQVVGGLLRGGVQRRGHDHLVLGQALGGGVDRHEIAFDVELEQRVVHVADHVVVLQAPAEREARLDEEPVECRQRLVGDHDGHLVALLQVDQTLPHLRVGDLVAEHAGLAVGRVRLQVVAEQTLPVGFPRVVDRMPMPVFHAVGAAGEMRVGLQSQLTGERQPAVLALGLGLEHQVVRAVLGGAGHVAAEGDLLAGQVVLGRVVDVHTGDVHALRRLEMVDGRLHAEGVAAPLEVEVVGDELVGLGVLAHDVGLPLEEFGHLRTTEAVELAAQRLVDRTGHIREVLPGVDAVGPVIQAEAGVELVQVVVEFLAQVLDEQGLHVRGDRVVVLGLVVDLIADDGRMVGHVRDEPADDALRVEPVRRVGDIHDLAGAVLARAGRGDGQDLGMHLHHPGGHRVGRRADDHVNAGALGRVEGAVNMREVEDARLGFLGAPGGFRDADQVDAGLLHHPHVFIHAVEVLGHVFVVVRRSEQDAVGMGSRHDVLL